jgi:competence/damage-inducible protein CinA C-terminal domain
MGSSPRVEQAAVALFEALESKGLTIACAESCTGGLVTAAITDIPGASKVLWGGVASYSNEAKEKLLGVSSETLAEYGAVSREVAAEMAKGILEASEADLALAITGIAGPEGGSEEKPVGLVWFAFRGAEGESWEESRVFPGDRAEIREAAAERALRGAAELAREGRSGPILTRL